MGLSFGPTVDTRGALRAGTGPRPIVDEEQPSILGAAFRQSSDIYSAYKLATRPTFPLDLNFSFEDAAKNSPLFAQKPESFIGVQSQAEWDFMEAKVQQELADRKRNATSGIAGIAANMLAGIISPTMLLPGGAITKAPKVTTAIAKGAAWSAVAVGTQEVFLQAQQELRTTEESMFAVGGAAVVGGVLGGAVRFLRKSPEVVSSSMAQPKTGIYIPESQAVAAMQKGEIPAITAAELNTAYEKIGQEIPDATISEAGVSVKTEKIKTFFAMLDDVPVSGKEKTDLIKQYMRQGAGDPASFLDRMGYGRNLSAAAVNRFAGYAQGAIGRLYSPIPGMGKVLSKLTPLFRLVEGPFDTLRWAANQLDTGGVLRDGHISGDLLTDGGTAASRAKFWYGKVAEARVSILRNYNKFMATAGKGSLFRRMFGLKDFKKFSDEVTQGAFLHIRGQTHAIPEVAKTSADFVDGFLRPLARYAKDNNYAPFKNMPEDEVLHRMLQMPHPEKLARGMDDALFILRRHALEQLLAVERKLTKTQTKQLARGTDAQLKALAGYTLETQAEEIAQKLLTRFMNFFTRHSTIDMKVKVPGDEPWRFYHIDPNRVFANGKRFGDFLETNPESIARSIVRTTSGDVELQRIFGTANPAAGESGDVPFWTAVQREFEQKLSAAKSVKEKRQLTKALRAAKSDFETLVQRIRHTRGTPSDPYALPYRMGRAIKQSNVVQLMGMVTLSSVADLARPVMKLGFVNSWRFGLKPLFKNFGQFKITALQARYAGNALDLLLHGRQNALADLFDDLQYGTKFERALSSATSLTGRIGLFDYWNEGLKLFSGHVVVGKMMHDIDRLVAGKASKAERAFLAELNIDETDARAIWDLVTKQGGGTEVERGVWFPDAAKWQNARLQRKFLAGLSQAIDDTIVTPGLERPSWVDASMVGSLIGQFRSFTFSSTFKVAMRGIQDASLGNYSSVTVGAIMSLALGGISYYLKSMAIGGKYRDKALQEFQDAINGDSHALRRIADEAIANSGLMAVLAEPQRLLSNIPATSSYVTLAGERVKRTPYRRPILDALGPTFGHSVELGEDVLYDPAKAKTWEKIAPYNNVFWLRRSFDALAQTIDGEQ